MKYLSALLRPFTWAWSKVRAVVLPRELPEIPSPVTEMRLISVDSHPMPVGKMGVVTNIKTARRKTKAKGKAKVAPKKPSKKK